MLPPVDVCLSVDALLVPDGHVQNPKIQFAGAEQEIKVTKWVELTKIIPVPRDSVIVTFG